MSGEEEIASESALATEQSRIGNAPFTLGEWSIDPVSRCASKGPNSIRIDPRNMRVLQFLVQRAGEVVPAREIEDFAWEGVVVTPASLYQSIRQLRQALGDTKDPAKYIETVPRKGYRLVAAVTSATVSPSKAEPSQLVDSATVPQRRFKWDRSHVIAATALLAVVVATATAIFIRHVENSRATASISDSVTGRTSAGITIQGDAHDVQGLMDLGQMALRQGRPREALELFQQALARQLTRTDERNEVVVDLLIKLANTYFWLEDDLAARGAAQRALKLIDTFAPADSLERLNAMITGAEVMIGTGEYDQAERLLIEASSIAQLTFRPGHAHQIEASGLLGQLRLAQRRHVEAKAILRQTVDDSMHTLGAPHLNTLYWRSMLATAQIEGGEDADAERELREVIATLELMGEGHPYIGTAKGSLARALIGQHKLVEAVQLLRAEQKRLDGQGASRYRRARLDVTMAHALLLQGELMRAEELLRPAEALLRAKRGWPAEGDWKRTQRHLQTLCELKKASRPALAQLTLRRSDEYSADDASR